ncbi:competence protein ComEC [Kitasatospora sp. MAP12-15]|nr:competence protein ComEC [Kitasatospora sp. MAP12-44]
MDLRLLPPALAAWLSAALLVDADARYAPLLLIGAGLAAVVAVVLLFGSRRIWRIRRQRRVAGTAALAVTAAVLLSAAASTVCTVLQTADLHRGPLPALARAVPADQPVRAVEVELTITGDPHTHTSRTKGSAPGQDLLTVEATADQVTAPSTASSTRPATTPSSTPPPAPPAPPTRTRTRTPVTVVVRARDVQAWQGLLPSTRLAAEVRVLPSSGQRVDSGISLLAEGHPRLLAQASAVQQLAGRLRSGLRQACEELSPDARALLPGLVIGDTSGFPDELQEAFHVTDLVHLIAVSGANLSIVLAVLLGAPGRAGTAERGGLAALLGLPLRIAALLGAALTLAFVTLCRPDPSVLRAAATGLVGLLALAMGRPRQAVPALAGAVLVLVLVDPYLSRSYGFLLSVLATAGLLTLGRRWAAALRERGWPHHLADGLAAAAAAQALCAPATVLLAPRVSVVGIPCNLLAELAVAPATLLGFGALVTSPFSMGVAQFLAGLAAVPTEWLVAVARYGAALPGAEFAWTPGWPGAALLAVAIAAAVSAAPLFFRTPPDSEVVPFDSDAKSTAAAPGVPAPRQPSSLLMPTPRPPAPSRRRRLLIPVLLVTALFLLLLRPPSLVRIATGWPPVGWRLVMCSIGQGDLLVLPVPRGEEAPDTAVVVDTGPDPAAADACLRDLGITRIPLVILSHYHADHSEGLPGVLHQRAVGAIETTTLDTPPGEAAKVVRWAATAHVPLVRAAPGEHRDAGPGLSWDVIWPAGPLGLDTPGPNNASVALLVTAGRLRFALLGDLEPAAQAELLTRARPGPVDVLKVAHHGSAHQDWELAAALRPRLALISSGRDNPYGHPAAGTVQRLRALGATVLRTDRLGDIAVLGDDPAGLRALVHPHPDTPDTSDAGSPDTGNPDTGTPDIGNPGGLDPALVALGGLSRPRAIRRARPTPRRPLPAARGPRPRSRPGPPGPPATGRPRRRPRLPARRVRAPTGPTPAAAR